MSRQQRRDRDARCDPPARARGLDPHGKFDRAIALDVGGDAVGPHRAAPGIVQVEPVAERRDLEFEILIGTERLQENLEHIAALPERLVVGCGQRVDTVVGQFGKHEERARRRREPDVARAQCRLRLREPRLP